MNANGIGIGTRTVREITGLEGQDFVISSRPNYVGNDNPLANHIYILANAVDSLESQLRESIDAARSNLDRLEAELAAGRCSTSNVTGFPAVNLPERAGALEAMLGQLKGLAQAFAKQQAARS